MEEGQFFGVQNGAKAIGLYSIGTLQNVTSAKAAFIFTERQHIAEIWVGHRRVRRLPVAVPPGAVVVIASGDALVALWPVVQTDIGRDAPTRLVDAKGDLVLEMYNYLGVQKSFWESRWPGFFFRGRPVCGVYVETAERSAYADGKAFGDAVRAGALSAAIAPFFTYAGSGERLCTLEYSRAGAHLGLTADIMAWALKRRWTEHGDLLWPMLDAPTARQTDTGKVTVGDATLICGREPAWLFASPATGRYIAGYLGLSPSPVTLAVPGGRVELEAMGAGTLVWDNGRVVVEALGLRAQPVVIYT
jgi:hypothetical protein